VLNTARLIGGITQMKIVMTISNGDGAYHLGLGVEHKSGIVEIPDESLPECVKGFLERRAWAAKDPKHRSAYETLTISVLDQP
jgi:hypothetical protein